MIDEKKLIEEIGEYTISVYGCDINDIIAFQTNNESKSAYIVQGICEAIDFIEEQPKVGEWIPCSERLPDERGTYIVNAIENHMVHVTFAKWMPRMKKWNLTGSRSYWKVTAWQPLPKPYRPEKESE